MNAWLLFVFALLAVGGVVAVYVLRTPGQKPRILPPPRSKNTVPSYQETNGLAKLFLQVIALKENSAKWPAILQDLNVEDEPHIRTLLLELRSERSGDPLAVLQAIEGACIVAKRESQGATRAELLNRALSTLRGTGGHT